MKFHACVLLLLAVVYASASRHICTFNDRSDSLPDTLDSYSYLGVEKEFHTHNEFYVNFTEGDHDMNFTLTEESAFRIYVAPHNDWDIDLYLYDQNSPSWLAHSSLDFFTEEVIQRTLPAGTYRVRFNFLSASLFRPDSDDGQVPECETLIMEASIVPTARVLARSSLFTCPQGGELLPPFTIKVSEDTGYSFKDSRIWSSNTTSPVGNSPKHKYVRFLKGYDFTLPNVKGTSGLWRLEATLGSDFLVGGSLGVMLDLNGTSVETALDCASIWNPTGDLPSCQLGVRGRLNEVVLRWVLESDVVHTLWLYDIYGESDRTLSSCVPFTFSLNIEPIKPPENILSCDAPFIPTTLNTPDLLGDRGYLHFKEDVFVDLANVNHDIAFTLKEKSVFRVFTEEHRVDIDLRLKNSSNTVLASSLQFNRRETIFTELDAGNYTLNLRYFGSYSVIFCETFTLDIAIAPIRYVPSSLCSGDANVKEKPDLSGWNSGANSFTVPLTRYRKTVDLHLPRQTIFTQEFSTTQYSQLRLVVGRDFLLGDLEVSIKKLNQSGQTILGEHRRNVIMLNTELLAGSYVLTLTTSGLQGNAQPLPNIPTCVAYTVQLNWKIVDVSDSNCWDDLSIVEALTTAFYIRPTEFHLTGQYLIPPRGSGVLVSQSIPITVDSRSQMRLYSEPHEIDIDFHILQGVHTLASATSGANEEEEFVIILDPGVTYTLLIQYFNMDMDPYRCSLYDVEVALSPVPVPPRCTTANLPADNFIPSPPSPPSGKDMFMVTGSYNFRGEDQAFSKKWTFTISESYYVRATVTYDFLWSNINARILLPAVGDEKETEFALGELAYNRNELPLTQLPPGTYLLEIYEPLGTTGSSVTTRCVPFSLSLAFAPTRGDASVAQSNVAYSGCPDYPLPTTLSTLSGISVFSNQTAHFQRRALANVKAKSEYVDFTLSVPSVFRIFVAHNDLLDIDVILYPGTAETHGAAILSRVGYGEESILKKLAPGNYTVKFLYFGMNHMPLPNPLDCQTFQLEIGITPIQRLESIPALTANPCQESLPPTYVQAALPFSQTFRFRHRNGFNHTMNFTTTQVSPFSVGLRYEFVSSGMSLELQGKVPINDGSTVNKAYHGQIGVNHAFLNEVILPGNYTLIIRDPTVWDSSDITTFSCAPFELSYFLQTTGAPVDYCDETESLPSDLFTLEGGSSGYGGPQKNDGSIKIFGDKFIMPRQPGAHNFIQFKVPQDSFFRIYSVAAPKNDIDFYIYRDVNRTFNSLTNYSNAFDEKESSLFLLKKQSAPYLLDVSYFSIDTSKPCNYFVFMLEMKPVAKVYGELACPAMLPLSLSKSLTLSSENQLDSDGIYVFTKSQVEHSMVNKKFRYRITLHVEDTTLFFVDIAFDFLANDFHLSLSDNQEQLLQRGQMRAGEPGEDFTMHNSLVAPLAPGVYFLDINEDLMKTDLHLNGSSCHKYGFSVSSFSERTPRVLLVTPESETMHNPGEDLVIHVTFSDPVTYPPADQLPVLTATNHWIYLKTETADRPPAVARITPNTLAYSRDNTVLILRWYASGLAMGKTYELQFDLSNFTTTGGLHFANAVQKGHLYQVLSDTCNGHGHVNASSGETICICDSPYTGDDCLSCIEGYHGVAYQCVPDVPCAPNTCNGHGTCSNPNGYPECQCRTGYATVGDAFCSVCADGYQGYPNCVAIPDPFDENTRCKADLLPVSLDGMAYLGFDGETRLLGNYFIDPLKKEHVTTFTVKQASAFRLLLAPHWVDVDVALYKRSGTKDTLITDGGFRMNTEESMFTVLDKTTGDDVYLLKFRYYVFTSTVPDCETLNLHIVISPIDRAENRVAANHDACVAALNSANGHLPLQGQTIHVESGVDYSFGPATLFATNGLDIPGGWVIDHFGTAPQGNFFWNITFTLPIPPEGQVMVLNAEVGSSFLEDGVVLLLERGNSRDHCLTRASNSTCTTGINGYNRNVLDTIVAAGTYTLWLFQPRQPFTNCTLFDFQLNINFMFSWSDTFYCQGARFPRSLNEPNYLDYNGVLHFQDDFLLENSFQPVNFTLTTESFFKIAVTAELVLSFDIFLFNFTAEPVLLDHSGEGLVTARLPPGTYVFEILVFDQLLGDECPQINMELYIIPTVQVSPPEYCSQGGSDVLPSLPSTLGSEPYQFNMSDTDGFIHFVTYKTGDIASYPIEVTELMWLIVEVASDFLTADVRPEMHIEAEDTPTTATRIVKPNSEPSTVHKGRANQQANHRYGVHEYNLNKLDWFLTPGTYTLKLTRPGRVSTNSPLASCGSFNFGLKLKALDADFCEGEELPTTFSSLRFLHSENNINYQQSSFFVPEGRFPTHKIYLEVEDKSLFRMYTEPHVIDIDLKLWQKNTTTDKYDILKASGKNGFYDEEVMAAILDRDEAYQVELLFYKWNLNNIPDCALFSMGFAIIQTANLPKPAPCPNNGSEHWPPAFPANMPTKPYYYDSTDPIRTGVSEKLYFQQSASAPRSKTYDLNLDDITDLYADVSYDFALGDLVLKLVNTISGETVYGTNEYNRNYLELTNLIPAKYTLTIYEPPSEDDTGLRMCAYFTFRIIVEKGGSDHLLDITMPKMPISLNGLSYLGYSKGVLHMQGKYSMFIPGSFETHEVDFSVDQASSLRLSVVSDDKTSSVSVTLKRKDEKTSLAIGKHIYKALEVGVYQLVFQYRSTVPSDEFTGEIFAVPLELAIKPTKMVADALNVFTNIHDCTPLSKNMSAVIIGDENPFFSRRGTFTIDATDIEGDKYDLGDVGLLLKKDTLIYVKLGFNFLFDDMYAILVGHGVDSTLFPYDGVKGVPSRNLNVINQLVPAGNYTLRVAIQPPKSSLWSGKHFCMPYSMGLFLQEAKNDHEHLDCIDYDLLPYNLNTHDGGSVPFGGPIMGGAVHISGNKFLLLKRTTNTMIFTVQKASVLTLLFNQPTGSRAVVSFRVSMKPLSGTGQTVLVTPVHANITYGQRLESFSLQPPSGGATVEIQLLKDVNIDPTGTCFYFAFDLQLKPIDEITKELRCPSGHQAKLPDSTVTFDQRGVGVQRLQAVMDYQMLDPSSSAFQTKVAFQVKGKPAAVAVSASFDSLSNFLYITISRATRFFGPMTLGRSTFSMVTGRDKTNLVQRIVGTLTPDNYTITLAHPNVDHEPFKPRVGNCFPYIWELQLVPISIPFVSFVLPEGGDGFNSFYDLVIRITLSEAPFTFNGSAPINEANAHIIMEAFKLGDLSPSRVELKTSDNTIWALTFPKAPFHPKAAARSRAAPTTLEEGKNYPLRMIDNMLFNSKGEAFIYNSPRTFSTLENGCSGHGAWNDASSQCACETGYVGSHCDQCAFNYVALGSVCVEDISGACKNASICGCSNPGAAVCDPLGQCKPISGRPFCHCKSNYAGDHCETCAPGFINYPLCKVVDECTPHCVHGECDTTSKTCKCDSNWKGSADCSKCTPGYSGADCKTRDDNGGSSSGFVKFLTISGILLAVFACFGGVAWLAWAQYKKYNWKKKISYFPLGLEELEDGMELQASSSFRDSGDLSDEEEKEKPTSSSKSKGGIFDLSDDEESHPTQTPKTSSTTVDNDFNPRARDTGKKDEDLLNL